MRRIGFSTGALARGDFQRAMILIRASCSEVVELSALRVQELEPLIRALPSLDLTSFSFVSIHAPSGFGPDEEHRTVEMLNSKEAAPYPVVVHPDVLFTPSLWASMGDRLLIENMDKRKHVGRTVAELRAFFDQLPLARFCFDIGHARQVDPTMTEAALLLRNFGDRLAEVHISEVNTASRHDPISRNAMHAFQKVAMHIPPGIPVILETMIDIGQSEQNIEIQRAAEALTPISAAA